jgi:hypothetical protein
MPHQDPSSSRKNKEFLTHEGKDQIDIEWGRPKLEKRLDVRLRDKLVADGKLNAKEVEEYIHSLEDDTENMEVVELSVGSDSKPVHHA